MKKLLLAGAAFALLGGTAFAQMQGGSSDQNMDQQMQNMQQKNPHGLQDRTPAENQARPDTGPDSAQMKGSENPAAATGGDRDVRQNTEMREQGTTAVRGHLTPTKAIPIKERTKIRETVIERGGAPRVDHINFTLRVGAPIPRSIRVVPVPEEIIAIYPEWSGFLYFVSGDEIIVVDPNSYAVVGVLEA